MRRIRTEILLHKYVPNIWVMELIEDDSERFVIRTHYGHREEKLKTRFDHMDEYEFSAIEAFEKKVKNKLTRDKDYRQPTPGENIFSPDLFRVLGDVLVAKRNTVREVEELQPEHRRLSL